MKHKKYQYAILEIAMYPTFTLEKELGLYGKDGWKIISVDKKFIIMEREIE